MKTRAEFALRASSDPYFLGALKKRKSTVLVQPLGALKGGRMMSRRTTILLVGAAGIGVGLLGMSSAFAAPASGAAIGEAASAGAVTQKVIWRGRGVGFRGVGFRGVGWRGGWGWRPGLAAAGIAAAGVAATSYGYGYPYGNYAYGGNYGYYGPGAYAANYGYGFGPYGGNYGYGSTPYAYGSGQYAANYGYGYQPYGYQSYGYQPVVGAAVAPTGPAPAVAPATASNEPTARRVRARTGPVQSQRWTRNFCVNAVHERLGVSAADAGKPTNKDAVMRCLQRGPMAIG